MITEAYPLQWPLGWARTAHPATSHFGSAGSNPTIHRATQELLRQLRLLKGNNVVISSDLRLRKDGLPVSSQRPPDVSGVAVYFTMNDEQKVIARRGSLVIVTISAAVTYGLLPKRWMRCAVLSAGGPVNYSVGRLVASKRYRSRRDRARPPLGTKSCMSPPPVR